jgi:hypothetical protein
MPKGKYKPGKRHVNKMGKKGSKARDSWHKTTGDFAHFSWYLDVTGSASQATRLNRLKGKYGARAVASSMGAKDAVAKIRRIKQSRRGKRRDYEIED